MGIHDGHRQRVIERFFREGLDNFTEVQVLEFLLFFIHINKTNCKILIHMTPQ